MGTVFGKAFSMSDMLLVCLQRRPNQAHWAQVVLCCSLVCRGTSSIACVSPSYVCLGLLAYASDSMHMPEGQPHFLPVCRRWRVCRHFAISMGMPMRSFLVRMNRSVDIHGK